MAKKKTTHLKETSPVSIHIEVNPDILHDVPSMIGAEIGSLVDGALSVFRQAEDMTLPEFTIRGPHVKLDITW